VGSYVYYVYMASLNIYLFMDIKDKNVNKILEIHSINKIK